MKLLLLCLALGAVHAQTDFVMDLVKQTYYNNNPVVPLYPGLSGLVGRRSILDEFKAFGESALQKLKEGALAALGNLPSTLLSAGLTLLPALLGRREIPIEHKFAELVKDEASEVLQKVEEAIKDAQHVAEGLEQHVVQAATGMLKGEDLTQLAQKVLAFLTNSLHSMLSKDTFEVDIENLVEKIIPNAISKLSHVMQRRFLLDTFTNGLGDTLKDVVGLAGQVLSGGKSILDGLLNGATSLLQPHIDNIKALASNFLSQAGTLTAQAAANAVKFFQPFATTLGPIFDQIKALAAKFIPENLLG